MDRERLAQQLMEDEGLRLKVYTCPAGKLSVGVGRNLEDRGITREEALHLLDNDITDFWSGLSAALPWLAAKPDDVQEVLVNMAFNMGQAGLLGFKNTLSLIKDGNYAAAADEMLRSRWASQVGRRAERLAEMLRKAA